MNYELMIETFPKLLVGLSITIQLVTISLFIGFCLAIGLALLRLSNNLFLNFFAKSYVFYFRGTPLLVQIFLIYYGIAQFELIREVVQLFLCGEKKKDSKALMGSIVLGFLIVAIIYIAYKLLT